MPYLVRTRTRRFRRQSTDSLAATDLKLETVAVRWANDQHAAHLAILPRTQSGADSKSRPVGSSERMSDVDTRKAPSNERSARITQGVERVMAQANCTFQTALKLMNARAQRSNTSIEIVAIAVLVGDIRFD